MSTETRESDGAVVESETPTIESNGQIKPEVVKFTRTRKKKEIQIDDEPFYIQEMTGTELGMWRQDMGKRVSNDGKKVTNFMGLEGELIAKCLFMGSGQPVPKQMINTWPATLQMDLFKMCQDINGMSEEGEKEAKNS